METLATSLSKPHPSHRFHTLRLNESIHRTRRQISTFGTEKHKGEFRSNMRIKIDVTYDHLIGVLRLLLKYFLGRQWVNKQHFSEYETVSLTWKYLSGSLTYTQFRICRYIYLTIQSSARPVFD